MAGHRKEQDENRREEKDVKSVKWKPKKIDIKSPDFVAPDGGWGWVIVLATGFSNFCVLSVIQSFGLLFMDKFSQLGITSSQITTLTSSNCAVTAFLGLANGPLFRKFSYRKIAFVGALLCTFSGVMLSFAKTFAEFLAFFSVIYGCGMGFTLSANSLALNTYFKEKRRVAIGLSYTCAGMGPIIMPQIITVLMPKFGQEGTMLLFGGFTFHAVACSLLLQPISWHVNRKKIDDQKIEKEMTGIRKQYTLVDVKNMKNASVENELLSKSMENIRHRRGSILTESRNSRAFGSQYLYYDDDESGACGIDVIEAGTPMMAKSNDGWSSKITESTTSLTLNKHLKKEKSNGLISVSLSQHSIPNLHHKLSTQNLHLTNRSDIHKTAYNNEPLANTPLLETDKIDNLSSKETKDETCKTTETTGVNNMRNWMKRTRSSIIEIFDLKLLQDPIYVNMMLGINLANFVELNFALLTPFVLGSYGFSKRQIATWMSVLAGMDVITRLSIPILTSYIRWSNRTFFLIGVCSMALGRIILAHLRNFGIVLFVAALIGAGKAFRTIFIALVIPGYVSLDRLPAALGLQLVGSGIIFFVVGPVIGWIQDTAKNYAITLHCLNILTYLVAISWIIEFSYLRFSKRKSIEVVKN